MGMTSAIFLVSAVTFSSFSSLFNFISFPKWLFTNAELVPLLPVLLIVGGLIILTLSYVSWRKYKGEKEKNQDKQKRDKLVD